MSEVELLSLALAVVGTLVAVWVALAGRQLLRPRFILRLGIVDSESELPFHQRFWRHNSMAIGVTAFDAHHIVLQCPLRLINKGRVPVNDVDLVLEFPAEALVEDTAIVGPVKSEIGQFQPRYEYERKLHKFGDLAQVRIPIGVLRPRETFLISEFLQLEAGQTLLIEREREQARRSNILSRYSSSESLRAAIQVRAMVWSSSQEPISQLFEFMWLAVSDVPELETAVNDLAQLSWKESTLVEGTYLSLRPAQPLIRREVVHFLFVDANDVADLTTALTIDGLLESDEGGVILSLPPWGLWGESFDLADKWGYLRVKSKR